ncbi:MAG: hypothetical protein Q4G05_05220 [Clostridia bacterium]|nr:hypothetical protein [Clostridia bacterium]
MLVFFIIVFLIIILNSLTIKLRIQDLNFESIDKDKNDFKIRLEIYLFKRLRIISINLKKDNRYGQYTKDLIQKYFYKKSFNDIPLNNFKFNLLQIDDFFLDLKIGFENMILTTTSVATISTLISLLLSRYLKDEGSFRYEVLPIYEDRNIYFLKLDCTISLRKFLLFKRMENTF